MSIKYCGYHGYQRRKRLRRILFAVAGFLFVVLIIVFLIWAILRPTKPTFTLQDATLNTFNVSTTVPNTLTVIMQVTLSAHNPNSRIGIYYHSLDAYASYRGQQVSVATALPDTYQGHMDFTVWSPFLYGNTGPVSPYTVSSMQQDRDGGVFMVNVKVSGRVKWKVGTWISGQYHLFVNCPAYVRVGGVAGSGGIAVVDPAVKFQLLRSCSVDV